MKGGFVRTEWVQKKKGGEVATEEDRKMVVYMLLWGKAQELTSRPVAFVSSKLRQSPSGMELPRSPLGEKAGESCRSQVSSEEQ